MSYLGPRFGASAFDAAQYVVFKGERLYHRAHVRRGAISLFVANGGTYQGRESIIVTETERATELANDATQMFDAALTKLMAKERGYVEASKKVQGDLRKQMNDLSDTVQRLHKTADLDRLDRYVTTLERMAAAMTTLAELQASGKLARIGEAIK